MTALDIAIVLVLVLSMVWGIWRGFVREMLSLAGWVLAFLAANAVAAPLGDLLPAPAVPERDGHRALGARLPDDVLVELVDDFLRSH